MAIKFISRALGLAVMATLFIGVAQAAKTYVAFPSLRAPTSIPGLMMRPAGDAPAPAVVLLHACNGMHNEEWGEFLSDNGYVALFIDTHEPRTLKSCVQPLQGVTVNTFQAEDAYGALDYLATLPFVDSKRVAVMGFSEGAITINQVLLTQTAQGALQSRTGATFKAAVALYGGCRADAPLPLMLLVGAKQADAASCAAGPRTASVQVETLANAGFGFDDRRSDGQTDALGNVNEYSAEATRRARELVLKFLDGRLK